MLRYRLPSCRSIRILMIRMSAADPWMLLVVIGLLPQEADRRCDFVGVDGVSTAGVDSLVGGDVSTSRQDTDGDLICCRIKSNVADDNEGDDCFTHFKSVKQTNLNARRVLVMVYYLCEFWEQVIDRWVEVSVVVTVSQADPGSAQTDSTRK